jgi:hypothetical protein
MLLLTGPFLGALIAPQAITNDRLDGLPVTPLSEVEPGGSYKVFAAVAPNQTDVVYGYWVGQTWTWTVRPFELAQNGDNLLVNASGLVSLREPGSPWGSQSGTILYGSGDFVAVYGRAAQIENSTVLEAQYISGNPGSMGTDGGDLWPLFVGLEAGFAAVVLVGIWLVARQKRSHQSAYSARPPTLPEPSPRPSAHVGEVRRFFEEKVLERIHQQTMMLVAGGPFCALGVGLMATDLVGPVFVGLFFLLIGGFFLFLGGVGRIGRWREVLALQTDDAGIWLEPLVPRSYPNDQFLAWGDLTSFWPTFVGSSGALLDLRSRRGEFAIGSFSQQTVKELAAELRRRGLSESKDWRFEPNFRLPDVASALTLRF